MSKSIKNLVVILIILTTVFGAYYFLTQESALVLRTGESDRQLEELLLSAQTFTARQQVLNAITLDMEVLDSEVFDSLRGYAPNPREYEIGRPDPFVPTNFTEESPE